MVAKVYVVCGCCKGLGRVELTGVYAETLSLIRQHPGEHGAALAKRAGCKATAMNNRLSALERHGVAIGKKLGRKILWSQK